MKKIPSLFQRNYETDRQCRNEVVPGCEWVFDESCDVVIKRKYDGACCMILDEELYKRYDLKQGRKRPEGFIPCIEKRDPNSNHFPGWLKCDRNNKADKHFFDAFDNFIKEKMFADFIKQNKNHVITCEACGPKFQGNPEKLTENYLFIHFLAPEYFIERPLTFDNIKEFLYEMDIEGLVFYHYVDDILFNMCKVKQKDFGLKRDEYKW